jgi:hypothetical protein
VLAGTAEDVAGDDVPADEAALLIALPRAPHPVASRASATPSPTRIPLAPAMPAIRAIPLSAPVPFA